MRAGVGERYAAARGAWVREAHARLERDPRVLAALLTGSLGRGTCDNWSDVDLLIVCAHGAEGELLADRAELVRDFGSVVLVLDSPWNAPPDGVEVNVLYEVDGDWPLYVDWDIWPEHRGAISPDISVLFDRSGLPVTSIQIDELRSWPPPAAPTVTPEFLHRARLAMLPIIAKCLVRGNVDRARKSFTNLGYQSGPTRLEALSTLRTLWGDVQAGVDAPLTAVVDRILAITSEA